MPSRLVPAIGAVAADARLEAIAQSLSARPRRRFFDQLVYKPPGQLRGTPWHQDFAYSAVPFAAAGARPPQRHLHLWLALDRLDAASGCIRFVSHGHGKLLPHMVVRGEADGVRTLAVDPARQAALDRDAVACAVAPGDLTAHHDGTPHCNPPNTTGEGRMFLVVSWERTDV